MSAPASLLGIVRTLGGDLYAGGGRANVPAPGHSASDRSISLLLSQDRVVVHSFGGADWREARDDLRRRGLIDDRGRLAGAGSVIASPQRSPRPRRERTAIAHALWSQTVPLPGTVSARHLRMRHIQIDPAAVADLRHHPAVPLSVYSAGWATRPALVAAIRDPEGYLTAVELTYLDPNGCQAAGLRLPRKTIGVVPAGSAVRLAPIGDHALVGEGLATTLSAMERFRLPGWALLSVRNLAAWSPPPRVRRVLIAADRGAPGESAARVLAGRLADADRHGRIAYPPAPWNDFNQAAADAAKGEGKGGAGRRCGGDGLRRSAGEPP